MKRVLAPVVALLLPVLGAISDAQESLLQAIADLCPAFRINSVSSMPYGKPLARSMSRIAS
ncbi:MAG TPA: hypothetical protein VF026_05100 [Ktedonobacteraceae bacterium]